MEPLLIGLPPLVGINFVALLLDFINGVHDAANSITTVVSTRAPPPHLAVIFNFIAFMVFGLHVATTVGAGIIEPSVISPFVILAGLIGASAWNVFTWRLGFPSSSSHALLGGHRHGRSGRADGRLAHRARHGDARITDLKPFQGCCAETAGAITLSRATWPGIPISTTHTITGAVVGVGAARRTAAVRRGMAGTIVWAWICTIPAAGGVAYLSHYLLQALV